MSTPTKIIATPTGTATPGATSTPPPPPQDARPSAETENKVEALPRLLMDHGAVLDTADDLLAALELRLLGASEEKPPSKSELPHKLTLRVKRLNIRSADHVSRLQRLLAAL